MGNIVTDFNTKPTSTGQIDRFQTFVQFIHIQKLSYHYLTIWLFLKYAYNISFSIYF